MKKLLSSICVGSLAVLLCSTVPAIGQDEEKQETREERLRRIEATIERLERSLPDVELDEELAEQIAEAIEGGVEQVQDDDLIGGIVLERIETDRVMIGVVLDVEDESDAPGIGISQVLPESPAAEAGLQVGDRIVGVNEEELETPQQLIEAVQENGDEKAMKLTIVRGDDKKEVELTPSRQIAQSFEIPDVTLPEGFDFGEDFPKLKGIELPEGVDLEHLQELIPNLQLENGEWQRFAPREGFHVIPPVRIQTGDEFKAEMEQMREQMEELREQMKEMAEQMKAMNELLKDRE